MGDSFSAEGDGGGCQPDVEVGTIKPSKPGTVGKGFRVNGRHFITINTSLSDMLTFAYGLHARQIVGGPA